MNTLDDLRAGLDAYADRDDVRGADAVWEAAEVEAVTGSSSFGSERRPPTRAPGSRRAVLIAVAAAAAIVLVGVVAGVRSRDEVGVVTTPAPDAVPSPTDTVDPPALPSVVVPDGEVRDVVGAFDRIWVVTDSEPIPGAARLRSFDGTTGEQVSDLPIRGTVQALVATDESLFVRLDQAPDLPARGDGPGWSGAVLRIDPSGRDVVDTVPLDTSGPIAARGSRVAFSDASYLHLYEDATGASTPISISDAVGHDNREVFDANRSATVGFFGLAFGPDGLFGTYAKGNELVQMDPATGAHLATQFVEDGAESIGPALAASDGYLWSAGATTVYGASTPIDSPPDLPAERRVVVGTSVSDLAPLDDQRFVALLSSQAVVGGDPDREDLRTTLDPAATGRIVDDHGRPWVAQWNPFVGGPTTLVSFVRVRTDDMMPGGAPPATVPPPVLTVMATEPLVDGASVPVAAAGLPAGMSVTFSVCLRGDAGPCVHVEPDPLRVERVGVLAGDGELLTNWTAQGTFVDDRTHDCAFEACVLRIYGVDAEGRRDTSTVLAETPLTFSAG